MSQGEGPSGAKITDMIDPRKSIATQQFRGVFSLPFKIYISHSASRQVANIMPAYFPSLAILKGNQRPMRRTGPGEPLVLQ